MARLAAGVRKRADGLYEKRVTIDGKRRSIYGRSSDEIAEKEQKLRSDIESGQYTQNKNVTLDKYFDEWIEHKRTTRTKSNSLRLYATNYREHISPALGKRKVSQIETREIRDFQKRLTDKVSITTCNLILTILKIILNDAVANDVITKSPARNIKPIQSDAPKATDTIHRALTIEEQRTFMEEMKSDHYYELIAFLLCTGMRSGEACALKWSDIDYGKNVIRINRTITFNEQGEMLVGNSPKTKAGKREIPMSDNTRRLLAMQRAKRGNVISINNDDLIFVSTMGTLINSAYLSGAINRALKRLDEKGIHIDRFSPHALRDTFATRFIEQGGSPQTLKTILGHSSLAMTMDLYAQVLPSTKQEEMNNVFIAI